VRNNTSTKSKLDPCKELIQRWLERHSYTATQIFQRFRAEEGYTGGDRHPDRYVRTVRRVRAQAFLTLAFAPGPRSGKSKANTIPKNVTCQAQLMLYLLKKVAGFDSTADTWELPSFQKNRVRVNHSELLR
jgi:hypothetical protein